jgi:hypothetical protein
MDPDPKLDYFRIADNPPELSTTVSDNAFLANFLSVVQQFRANR